jgi:hypothetical protein
MKNNKAVFLRHENEKNNATEFSGTGCRFISAALADAGRGFYSELLADAVLYPAGAGFPSCALCAGPRCAGSAGALPQLSGWAL